MTRICVVVADRAQGRFFTLDYFEDVPSPHDLRLDERRALLNPETRVPGRTLLFSDVRSGTNRAPPGAAFRHDDHEKHHLEESERRFAGRLAQSLGEFVRREHACRLIVVAEPQMLGLLRERVPEFIPPTTAIVELARNLVDRPPRDILAVLLHDNALATHEVV